MSTSRSIEFIDFHTGKLRVICAGLLAISSIYLLALLLSTMQVSPAMEVSNNEQIVPSSSDNAVAAGMATAGAKLKKSFGTTGVAVNNGLRSFELGAVDAAKFIVHSGATGAGAVYQGGAAVVGGIANGVAFVARVPGNIISSISRIPSVGNIVTPAATANTVVPVIDPASGMLTAAQGMAAANPTPTPTIPAKTEGIWPINGAITTKFGVPHWPYQPIHTGIDISDGQRSGVTPIKPFKPGRVTEVIQSSYGLGNHVIVDHGGGVSSVYGHLSSTSVQVGQQVDTTTQLGFEGSTGASTGTHLHLEIRVNGQATDPHTHISGHP